MMDFQTFLIKKMTKQLQTRDLFNPEILRIACRQHLETTIMKFQIMGAGNLTWMQPRWLSLLKKTLFTRTAKEALKAWTQASQQGKAITRSFVEKGSRGRMFLVTSAPWLEESRFLYNLPERNYFLFIKPHRETFHRLSKWKQREFVHWIFLAGEDENGYQDISVSLFYLESFESLLKQIALTIKARQQVLEGKLVSEFEAFKTSTGEISFRALGLTAFLSDRGIIVPLSFLSGNSAEGLVNEILRLDITAQRAADSNYSKGKFKFIGSLSSCIRLLVRWAKKKVV